MKSIRTPGAQERPATEASGERRVPKSAHYFTHPYFTLPPWVGQDQPFSPGAAPARSFFAVGQLPGANAA